MSVDRTLFWHAVAGGITRQRPRRVARLSGRLAVLAVAANVALSLVAPQSAHAAWLGKRGVIAFSGHSASSSKSSIWFMNADGSGISERTPNDRRNDLDPAFSPEGGPHIVYVGKPRSGGPGDLFVIDRYPPGGGLPKPINITAKLAGDAEHPAFSPSGGKIVFDLTVRGRPTRIWTSSLSGRVQGPLTCCRPNVGGPVDQPIEGSHPAWSPNSRTIAYVAPDPNDARVQGIWLAAYDGRTKPVFLTDGRHPNWSPLGDKLVYVRDANLWVANPNPGNPAPQAITNEPPAIQDSSPAWTPDSTHLPSWKESPGTVIFLRGAELWRVRASPAPATGVKQADRISSPQYQTSGADWQPKCSNKKRKRGAVIKGTARPDLLCGGKGDDRITGYGGADRIFAGAGHDLIHAGPGDDFILGGVGADGDVIYGGAGNDHIEGGQGQDRIYDYGRGSGSDTVSAGDAADTIVAWDRIKGNDRIDAGGGDDTCVVDNTVQGHTNGVDFIWNCEHRKLP